MKVTRALRSAVGAADALLMLSVAFWYFRIIRPATQTGLMFSAIDLFTEHYPMAHYGFSVLRSGHLPLWNPYQLCGEPFLPTPYAGLFYPGNVLHLLLKTAVAIEATYVVHLAFAGLGMWLLARTWGLSVLGAYAGAVTFMLSGWMCSLANQPGLIKGMCWLPMTVFFVERTLRGSRAAPFGLVIVVACQVFNGASEFFVENMDVSAIYALFSLAGLCAVGQWRVSAKRSAMLTACVIGGTLLSALELVPALELIPQTVRAPGSLPAAMVLQGAVPLSQIVSAWFLSGGFAAVGVLPIVGVGAGIDAKQCRMLWAFSLVLGTLAVLMLTGGRSFILYSATPLGRPFRNPEKFFHVFSFAQALLAAIALSRLGEWLACSRGDIWRTRGWIGCLWGGSIAVTWLASRDLFSPYLATALVLLLAFGLSSSRRLKVAATAALLLLQGSLLFFSASNAHVRPAGQPDAFERARPMWETLRDQAGHDRVYVSPACRYFPAVTLKQGMLNKLHVTVDYETLSAYRYKRFFELVAGPSLRDPIFSGAYALGGSSHWQLMDLTSTRFYVVMSGEDADKVLSAKARDPSASGFRLALEQPYLRVYERSGYLPRAYFVPRARVMSDPEQLLEALDSPAFNPHEVVLLESDPLLPRRAPAAAPPTAATRFLVDLPERLVIEVQASGPGFVVLTDLFYPGWEASVGGRQVPLYRANYLFRAVPVEAGLTRVTFSYAPPSVRTGLRVSELTLLVVTLLGMWSLLRRHSTS